MNITKLNEEQIFAVCIGCIEEININRRAKLYDFFGDFRSIWYAKKDDMIDAGMSEEVAKKIIEEIKKNEPTKLVESIIDDAKIITKKDKNWPRFVNRGRSQMPVSLFLRGELPTNNTKISIVGSRNPSVYAEMVARKIIGDLAEYDVDIVSGLAIGVDKIAHQLAIDGGRRTFAFLANRINDIYPMTNKKLADDIVRTGGGIMSEYARGNISKERFPERNRLIAGISDAVIVIEAKIDSGTIWTANWARKLNIPLYVIPADITRESAMGSNMLLQNGAKALVNVDSILKDLNIDKKNKTKKELIIKDEYRDMYDLIRDNQGKKNDEIANVMKKDISFVNSMITDMELEGLIYETQDGWVAI